MVLFNSYSNHSAVITAKPNILLISYIFLFHLFVYVMLHNNGVEWRHITSIILTSQARFNKTSTWSLCSEVCIALIKSVAIVFINKRTRYDKV